MSRYMITRLLRLGLASLSLYLVKPAAAQSSGIRNTRIRLGIEKAPVQVVPGLSGKGKKILYSQLL